MATVRRLLWGLGLVALVFAPGALADADIGDGSDPVEAAAFAPTFASSELARARTADPAPTLAVPALPAPPTAPVVAVALAVAVAVLAVHRPRLPALVPVPVGRRGPPPSTI